MCRRSPRERSSVASGRSSPGAGPMPCGWRAKVSIQPTERMSAITCQKQASTPSTKKAEMALLSQGFDRKMPRSTSQPSTSPAATRPSASSIDRICRTG